MKKALLCRQGGQTLSCATIEDLPAFRVPESQQSWCILEFVCREVHGSSGDWVVHFTNHEELCDFREVLETMWASITEDKFPVSTISPDDKLHRRCTDSNKNLQEAWQDLLPVSV
ncbi:hypothetical protein QAD02_013883 [Eretmocerus hayati]|uniref:Uncharacterized protein n=1 Tax=Eretmocerus hayati TaxID=131215 RepID=A0ACC2P3T5_9HYME|nr:hypothetical protein QAD02_013883 [Eretmocerus hayati]